MINVRLMMDVLFHDGLRAFFRDITMPALPPIGCTFCTAADIDCIVVEKYWYIEHLKLFVVAFERYDIAHIRNAYPERFLEAGWMEDTNKTPFCEVPFSQKAIADQFQVEPT